MKKKGDETIETPVSSLIDVVFLLIIFFVVTAAVEKEVVDESIKLAQAKYMKEPSARDPRTVTISVAADGRMNTQMQPLSLIALQNMLTAAGKQYGNSLPIVIRVDQETEYTHVDKIVEVVGKSNLYKIKLAAVINE